jgi:serine/threonine-protein kinase
MLKFWKRDEPAVREDTDRIPERITWAAVPRWRLAAVLLLSAFNAALAGALLLQHHGDATAAAAVAQVCGAGAESGCEAVARSPYSTLRGVPVAALGLVFSLSVALLMLLGLIGGPDTRAAAALVALALLALALLVAVVLLGVQVFAIKALCKLCVLTYAVNALAFVILLPTRRDRSALRAGVRYPEGRVAMAGWALGSLAVLAAVLAGDRALAARHAGSPAAVLGTPAPAPLPPAPAGSDAQRYQEEARVAHEEARRLQEILDDPRKLEEYFAQKAAREFDQGPVANLNLKTAPFKGPAEAPIRVVEFSDFLCPYCRQIATPLGSYVAGAGNRVVLYFKNYPLDQECNPNISSTLHPGACALALGAICAQEQGKFWPYHDRVFSGPPRNPGAADVVALAASAGLDGAALGACMGGAAARSRLAAEIQEAKAAMVEATPTLFINGRKLPRVDVFVQTMDREAARMGLPPLAPPPNPQPPPGH